VKRNMCDWENYWNNSSSGFFSCSIGEEDYCKFYVTHDTYILICKFRESGTRICHSEEAVLDAKVSMRLESI